MKSRYSLPSTHRTATDEIRNNKSTNLVYRNNWIFIISSWFCVSIFVVGHWTLNYVRKYPSWISPAKKSKYLFIRSWRIRRQNKQQNSKNSNIVKKSQSKNSRLHYQLPVVALDSLALKVLREQGTTGRCGNWDLCFRSSVSSLIQNILLRQC